MPALGESCRQQAHEPGETDQSDSGPPQRAIQRRVEGLTAGEFLMRDDLGGDPGSLGPDQATGIGAIGDHQRDFRRKRRIGGGVDQGLQVAAAPGDQDAEPQLSHAESTLAISTRFSLDVRATTPMTHAPVPSSSRSASSRQSAPTMAIMPMPQLKVRASSAAGSPPTCAIQRKT